MAIVLEKRIGTATAGPDLQDPNRDQSRLDISVVFTSVEATLAALRHAGALADRLAGRITLLVPQIVPYPLPLTSPPVLIDWNERRFRVIAEASQVETRVRLYLCRDREDILKDVALRRRSVVVIGGPRKWRWFATERRLAGMLRRSGHEVVYIETE